MHKLFRYETNPTNIESADNNDKAKNQPSPRLHRMSSRTLSEENIVVDVGKETLSVQGFQENIQSAVTGIKNVISGADDNEINNNNSSKVNEKHSETLKRNYAFSETKDKGINDGIPKAPEDEFIFSVPRHHLMSPYIAPDEILRQLPKINILTTIVDPCIDDCVEFAKKLRALNVDVEVDIVGALNHGFLNFAHVSFLSSSSSYIIELVFFSLLLSFCIDIERMPRCIDAVFAANCQTTRHGNRN